MPKRRKMIIHIERLANTKALRGNARASAIPGSLRAARATVPVCVAVEARLRTARAALQRAPPRCKASRTGRSPACRGSSGRPGTSSGRTGGPPTCPTVAAARAALLRAEAPAAGQARPRAAQAALRRAMAATTARLRCGPHRRPSAVPSCRRVRSGREVRPRSPGHGSSGREAHSMSSVSIIVTCSPLAARSAASSASGC